MNLAIRIRLGAMMFLQYFVWGAWYVTIGTWLVATLHLSGQQAGLVTGTTALGAIVSPFFVGVLADKRLATQTVLGILHVSGSLLLLAASYQTRFTAVYGAILVYSLCFMPTLALTNSLAFRQMSDPQLQFGPIRVFGTLGWIVAGVLVGLLGLELTAIPLRLAAAASAVLGLYCFTLPNTPPLARQGSRGITAVIPLEAVRLLKGRSMGVFALASLLICIPLQFYYAFTNLFLNEAGVANAAAKMTGGQFSELFCMLLIPWFFRRLGVKYMLALGMFMWVARYVLFAYGNAGEPMPMFWAGIAVHGICYDFFFVVGQIYIDRKAPATLRGATQGLITLLTYGVGMFIGAWLSGVVVDAYSASGQVLHDWRSIWLVAAASAGVVPLLFLASFTEESASESVKTPSGAAAAR